jgi:hypothetical protein
MSSEQVTYRKLVAERAIELNKAPPLFNGLGLTSNT